MGIISYVGALVKLVPLLRQLVDSAEVLFPEGGSGAKKLEAVKNWLSEAARILGVAEQTFAAAWPLLDSAITLLVKSSK